jgi:hypothetical protein
MVSNFTTIKRGLKNSPLTGIAEYVQMKTPSLNKIDTRCYGWGGRIRTSGCRNQNPVPYHLATPQIPGWLTRVRCPAVQAITQIPAVFSGIDEFKIFLKDRIR